jgi:hypothetical protein
MSDKIRAASKKGDLVEVMILLRGAREADINGAGIVRSEGHDVRYCLPACHEQILFWCDAAGWKHGPYARH